MKRLLLLFLLLSSSALATTRYVDGKTSAAPCTANYSIAARTCSGADGNSYATIALALAATSAGDTVDIRGAISGFTGIYNETMLNTIPAGISIGSRTRVIGHAGETVEIKPTATVSRVITVTARSYIEISHLTITGGADVTGNLVAFENSGSVSSDYYLFDNNILTNPGGTASNSHHCFTGTDNISDQVGWTVSNNTVTSCESPGYGPGNVGIYTNGSDGTIEGNIVTCTSGMSGGIRNGESNNVYRSDRTIIRNNKVSGGSLYAIAAIYIGDDRQVYNNIVYTTASGSAAIRVQGRRTLVYNNTIWNAATYGVYMLAGSQNHVVRNNIVSGTTNSFENGATGVTFSNNLCSTADTGCNITLESAANTFTNTATADFSLKSTSIARDTGYCTNISSSCTPDFASNFITTDYSAVTRANGTTTGSQIDIGALEYVSAAASITILVPTGTPAWEIGTTHTFTWTSANLTGPNINITADLDNNGSYETTISSGTIVTATNSFDWLVAGSASACTVKIKDSGSATESTATFSMTASPITPTITITSPLVGMNFAKGSNVVLSWNSTGLSGNILIELTRNGGGTWYTIGTYAFDSPDINWTATIPSSSHCQIRYTSVNAPTVTATSGVFRLGGRIM